MKLIQKDNIIIFMKNDYRVILIENSSFNEIHLMIKNVNTLAYPEKQY